MNQKICGNPLLVLRPNTWQEAVLLARKMGAQYVFRGQANEKWELSTKIERICRQNQFPTDFLKNREDVILREFQRRAHHYINDAPALDNKLEWLALIQHFGGATRLLDFTKLFYVAAFFAMESSTTDAAVWALNDEILYQHTDNTIGEGETIYNLHEKSRKIVERNLSGNHEILLIIGVEPERLNERISIQQGLFVIPGNLKHSFADNLAATLSIKLTALKAMNKATAFTVKNIAKIDCFKNGLIKIILPREIHNAALLDLDSMNINAATLFPGLVRICALVESVFTRRRIKVHDPYPYVNLRINSALPKQRTFLKQSHCSTHFGRSDLLLVW